MRRLSRPDFDSRGWRDGRVRDLQTRASGMDRPLSKEQGGTCWLEVMRCNKSACQWRELQPMAFGGKAKAPAKATKNEGEGFEMGAIRGTGDDGAGRYETVGEGSSREPT